MVMGYQDPYKSYYKEKYSILYDEESCSIYCCFCFPTPHVYDLVF